MILIEILPRRSFSHWARSLWWYMVDWHHLSSVATSSMTQTISSSATHTMNTYGLQFHSTSTSSTCSCLCCNCWGQRIVELVNLPLRSRSSLRKFVHILNSMNAHGYSNLKTRFWWGYCSSNVMYRAADKDHFVYGTSTVYQLLKRWNLAFSLCTLKIWMPRFILIYLYHLRWSI